MNKINDINTDKMVDKNICKNINKDFNKFNDVDFCVATLTC